MLLQVNLVPYNPCALVSETFVELRLDVRCRKVELVAFGHMHSTLAHPKGRHRRMIRLDPISKAICLNTAEVPRIRMSARAGQADSEMHHFMIADFNGSALNCVSSVWVAVDLDSLECSEACRQPLMQTGHQGLELFDDFLGEWAAASALQCAA